jgi:OOP family OmpA-OmpF porin
MNTKIHRSLSLLALASLAALTANPALAQQDEYVYFGLSGGASRSHLDDGALLDAAMAGGITNLRRDRSDRGWRVFGGRQFNSVFGMEAGYFDLGRFEFGADTPPAGSINGRQRVQGVNLDLVGTLPVTQNLSMLGRVGAVYARARASTDASIPPASTATSERGAGSKFGVGLQYAFGPSFLVRGEMERYRVRDAAGRRGDVDLATVSLVFPFGRAPTAARSTRAEPAAYVAQAPAPAPMPAPVYVPPLAVTAPVAIPTPAPAPMPAPAPERRRVSYEAESMFGFDSSDLQAEGRQGLDRFAGELDGARYDTVKVKGHTDRLGSAEYNQALSLRRAEAVKQYLVTSGRIDPARISASGLGQTQPVTRLADCVGTRRSTALVNCLQPDRRVEIEVVGTR